MGSVRSTRLLSSALLIALASSQALAQQVLTVGGDGGFDEIATAVDLAADGDIVLVRAGSYASFSIVAKSLTVTHDSDALVVVGGTMEVRDLAADQTVFLRGLTAATTGTAGSDALVIGDCAGAVRVESCSFTGRNGVSPNSHGGDGVDISDAAAVSFVRCTMRGGRGASAGQTGGSGGAGVNTRFSSVYLYSSSLTGGDGAFGDDLGGLGGGGHSDPFILGFVHASGCVLVGGDGGGAADDDDDCGIPGSGGHGIQGSAGMVRSSTTFGGAGGFNFGSEFCPKGSDGLGVVGAGLVPGSALPRSVALSSPVRESEQVTVTLSGQVGDTALMTWSMEQEHVFVPSFQGAVLVPLGGPSLRLDALTDFKETFAVPVPDLPAGIEGIVIHTQAWFASGEATTLDSPSSVVILDTAF